MLREKGRLVVPKPVKKSTKAERNMRARIRAKTKLGEDKYKRLRDRYNMLVFGYISWVTQKKKKMIEEKRREPVTVVGDCFSRVLSHFLPKSQK